MIKIPVSVLISTYKGNKAEYLSEALNSIARQSYIPEEIILIVDGKIDAGQMTIISQFRYAGEFKVHYLDGNYGLAHCMNLAMKYSSKPILARMDADDVCYKNRFEIQYKKIISLNDENYVICSWHTEFNRSVTQPRKIKKTPERHETIKRVILYRNAISHPTIMFHRTIVETHGGYNESVGRLEDYELHLRLIRSGVRYYGIQHPLVYVRADLNLYSRRGGLKYLINEYKFRVFCYKMGYIGFTRFVSVCFVYSFMRLAPLRIRKLMYNLVRK